MSHGGNIEISAKSLCIKYSGKAALECESLSCRGNIIALIGHNGAGKSTMLKSILDLLPRDSGTIGLFDRSGEKAVAIRESDMAFCPEEGSVFADITVESYVRLWCRLKHRDPDYYKTAPGARYLEMLDIVPLLKKLGRSLSKGERRRVQTAIGLLTNPKAFLLDEPFDGLDVQRAHQLAEIIEEERSGTSFIISSHRLDVIEMLADKVIVLNSGRVAANGSVREVCSVIAGQRYALFLDEFSELNKVQNDIQSRFKSALIRLSQNELSILPRADQDGDLKRYLSQKSFGAKVQESEPSLIEVMNLHLREMKEKRKIT